MCSVDRVSKRKLNTVDSGDEPLMGDNGKRRKDISRLVGKGTDAYISLERAQLTPQQRKSLGLYNIESPKSASTTPVSAERNPRNRVREIITGSRATLGSVSTPLGRNSPRPATPLNRRSAAPEEDVTAVYTECIKLSAANKINTKNAFGLRLIDYMSHLIKQKPNEKINFKLVSSALDAGAKIYGHRVDCVQAEAQKVASGLVIALDKDKSKEGENNEGDFDGDDVNEDGETRPKRRKVVKKTVKTIATNIETLNTAKVECNTPPDPLFSLLSSSFDVGNVNGLLMSNLCLNEDGLLLLNPTEITSSDSQANDVQLDRSLIDGILNQRPQIVPQLSKFEFLSRGEDLDNSMSTLRAGTQTQDKLSFALDGGVSLSQPFEASLEPVDNDDHHDAGGFFDHDSVRSYGEEDAHDKTVIEKQHSQSLNNQYLMRTVDSDGFEKLVKVLSDQPSEYSYFNKELLGAWAGPEHWTKRPGAKKALPVPKSARKPKNKFNEIDFKQNLPSTRESGVDTKLKFPTLSNWQERLLPIDGSYQPLKLIKPFLKDSKTFSILRRTGIDPNANDEPSFMNDNCSDGRSSPGLDAGMDNHYDDEFPPTQECFSTQAFNAPFSGDNLVDEPFAVSSTALPFSTHAKKIDVKRLKKEMWTIVTSEVVNRTPTSSQNTQNTQNTEPSTNNDQEQNMESTSDISSSINPVNSGASQLNSQEQELTFSDMYKKLPDKVGTTMANNLSVPIAFVALLHLTNEKNLQLQGKTDLSDFIITPESIEC